MKRLIVLVLVGLLMVCPSFVFAAGASTTATCANYLGGTTRTITYSWVGDASGGAVTSLASGSITCPGGTTGTTFVQGYYLCGIETSTTVAKRPTDDYDLYLYDALSKGPRHVPATHSSGRSGQNYGRCILGRIAVPVEPGPAKEVIT